MRAGRTCPDSRRLLGSVDGCRSGWLLVMARGWPCLAPPRIFGCRDFREVLASSKSCRALVVDMPIGLPSRSERRLCDELARERLGWARSRVFYAPPRPALRAKTPEEFQRIHRRICGRGAGYPVWNIAGKMREVDEEMTPELQERVLEFHPELAWQRLARAGQPLESKHRPGGIQRRIAILRRFVPGLDGLLRLRAEVAPGSAADDLLDALVGLSVAAAISGDSAYECRLHGGEPPRDRRGLRMEIWY